MTLNQVNDWVTPTLSDLRQTNRDNVRKTGIVMVPNDWPQILADANAGLAHLNLQYLDFMSAQFLPLTATGVFLDKHATIYLLNSDGTRGRKVATYASGTASITANVSGTILPAGTQFSSLNGSSQIIYETTAETPISTGATSFPIRSLTPGAVSNLDPGTGLTLTASISGLNMQAGAIEQVSGGADIESDDAVRARILNRLANTPMSGSSNDYEVWALSVPGVTRAWCSPNEIGAGTVTIRFMCDQLRATSDPLTSGLPWQVDIDAVAAYIETVRPVTVSQVYVVAPVPQLLNVTIANLNKDTVAIRQAIETSIAATVFAKARPARAVNGTITHATTIYAASINSAIYNSTGVRSFDLMTPDFVPAHNGNLTVFGQAFFTTNG